MKEHFSSPNFENLPEYAILRKLGFKPFNNGLLQKEKNKLGTLGGFEPSNTPFPEFLVFFTPRNSTNFFYHSPCRFQGLKPRPLEIPLS